MKKLIYIPLFLFLSFAVSVTAFAQEQLIEDVNAAYEDLLSDADLLNTQKLEEDSEELFSPAPKTRPEFSKKADVAAYIKAEMLKRTSLVSFRYHSSKRYTSSDIQKLISELISMAVADKRNGAPNEGDYLRWHYGGYRGSYTMEQDGTGYRYTLSLAMTYFSTAKQEKKLESALNKVLSSLNLTGKSEYEKANLIYSYVTSHVSYAYLTDAKGDPGRYSAYSALIRGSAVCQGYATLLYRMFKTAGLSCRFISGYANGVRHGWNIVKIGSCCYNLDATWDSTSPSGSTYFLKNDQDFKNHTRDSEFNSPSFRAAWPMAVSSYEPSAAHTHTWGKWKTVKKATIFSSGTLRRTCRICGKAQSKKIARKKAQVRLNTSFLSMHSGQTGKKLAIAEKTKGDRIVRWTSSNKAVAVVNKKSGKIRALKKGTTKITLTMKSGASASCTLRVYKGRR